jgi:hypothetical protein
LANVFITSTPSNGQALIYDTILNGWIAGTVSSDAYNPGNELYLYNNY